jgi:cell division protein FtsL
VASHSLPVPFRQPSQHALTQGAARVPSLRTVAIVFVILLILFQWLHLILALEMAATSREMQHITEEIERQERLNALLLRAIAEAESPRRMGELAESLAYMPGTRVYIELGVPLAQASGEPQFGVSDGESAEVPSSAPGATEEALSDLFYALVGTSHSQ